MAIQNKTSLDYYPMETHLINDNKFIPIKQALGNIGVLIYVRLLELIYSDKGYYIEYSSLAKQSVLWDLKISFMMFDENSDEFFDNAIKALVEANLFDKNLFEQGYITSKRIQKTYYQCTAARRNVMIKPELWLIGDKEMAALGKKNSIYEFLHEGEAVEREDDNSTAK